MRAKRSVIALPVALLWFGAAHAQDASVAAAPAFASTNAVVAAPSLPTPPPKLGEGVAAVVNDEIISTYDVRQRMRLLVVLSGVQPTEENVSQIAQEAIRTLIDEHLEMQEIRDVLKKQKDLHLVPTDQEIDETMDDMAKQAGVTRAQFLATLRSDQVDVGTLRDQIRAQLAWRRYIAARFRDSIVVGDDSIKAAMARVQAAASKPQYQVSEIFIDAAHVGGQATALDGARQLVEQIQHGAPFAAVAQQFSALPSAANGGDEGWLTSGEIPPEVEAALQQMRPGQVSQPIPVPDGVYIVALRDKRAGAGAPMVHLKQVAIAVPENATATQLADAQAKLEQARANIKSCDDVEAAAAKVPGVLAGDLGDAEVAQLNPTFQSVVNKLQVGQVSEPVRTSAGLHVIALCSRHATGAQTMTRDEVEERLRDQQFAMFSRRYLRDLRNSATIETR